MPTVSLPLSNPLLDHLVPYHVTWTPDGVLTRISPALLRYWRLDPADPMSEESILLVQPFRASLLRQWFEDLTAMVLTIQHEQASDRSLRAELIEDDGGWWLVGSPAVSRVSELEALGLTLSDLPVHNGIGDLLIANEAAEVSLKESERAAHRLQEANTELRATNETFSRFVPEPFLKVLGLHSPGEAALGAHVGVSESVMFADLRSFTTLSERLPSREIFDFINKYLAATAPNIREQGGFVVHYLGDGIMALFQNEPDRAVRAAINMQESLRHWTMTNEMPEDFEVRLGIGIHYGQLSLGIVGESGRWDSSVISDAVNTAARVEGLTKTFGADLLITQAVIDEMERPQDFRMRRLGRISVKGKAKRVDLFEVMDALSPERQEALLGIVPAFHAALDACEAEDFETATKGFLRCSKICPDDLATLYYLEILSPHPEGRKAYRRRRTDTIA